MTFIEKYKKNLLNGKMNIDLENELFLEIKEISKLYIPKLKSNNLSLEDIKEIKLYSKLLRNLIYFRVLKESNHIAIKKEIENVISGYLSLPLEVKLKLSESKIKVIGPKTCASFDIVNSFYAISYLLFNKKEIDLFFTFLIISSNIEDVIAIGKAYSVKKYLVSNKI